MTGLAFERVLDALRAAGRPVSVQGNRARSSCPGHDGDNPTGLSILDTADRVNLHCFTRECEGADILAALGLTIRDRYHHPIGDALARYAYGASGYAVTRRVGSDGRGKAFSQSRGWSGRPRPLYRAERVAEAVTAGRPVYLVEGEEDVHALEAAYPDAVAVTAPQGASNFSHADVESLRGATVIAVPDADVAGANWWVDVRTHLNGVADQLVHGVPAAGKDLADHLTAGHTLDELLSSTLEESTTSAAKLAGPVGVQLLDAVERLLSRYVVYPGEHERVAHVLWIAHTHLMGCWESTPRIAFLSPEPGSGKSRALEVTEPLVPRAVHAVNATPAYLFRKVSDPAGPPTILFDEIDTIFGPKAKDNEELRGMLNAGHRRGAMAGRCVIRGKEVQTEELPAYAAVALAGLDDLPDTIMSRSVVIRMRRRARGEQVEPWRLRTCGPEASQLGDQLATWARSVADRTTWPSMPAGVEDRAADVWEALLAVADLAEGDWPRRAREAAVAIVTRSAQRPPSLGVLLLRDLRTVFTTVGRDRIPTEDILAALVELDESPWGNLRGQPLNARGLSSRLSRYDVRPRSLRDGDRVFKGYDASELADAWVRYLADDPHPQPDEPVTSVTRLHPVRNRVTDVTEESPNGRAEPATAAAACTVCQQRLHPAVVADGFTTCPTCEVVS